MILPFPCSDRNPIMTVIPLLLLTMAASAVATTTSLLSHDSASSTLNKTLNALGGLSAWQQIDSITFRSQYVFCRSTAIIYSRVSRQYRSHTLGQNYNLFEPDQSVATTGSQNISSIMTNNTLHARIERSYIYDDYWIWAFPDLHPFMNFTVVVRDGPDGYACFNQGQNSFYAEDPIEPLGYADAYLTDYLVRQARQFALPWLLQRFAAAPEKLVQYSVEYAESEMPLLVLEDVDIGLALLIDPVTFVPFGVRAQEQHTVYGNSTNDLVFSAWSTLSPCANNCAVLDSALLPHRLQTVYNSYAVLEDIVVDSISINTISAQDFEPSIDTASSNNGDTASSPSGDQDISFTPSPPTTSDEYPRGDVHEFYESGLWNWPVGEVFNVSQVVVQHPFPHLPEIMTVYAGEYPDYVQLLVEHETGLLITDAAPHRSKAILVWVAENMKGKNITHVVPSHHHRDHAGGVNDYVAAGGILVVPEIASSLYNLTGKVPSSQLETYTDQQPFVFKDRMIEFRSFWKDSNPHARDWTFSVATRASPTGDDEFALFNADVVNPGTDATRWDTGVARRFLINAVEVGVPRSSLIVGAHGSTMNGTSTSDRLSNIAEICGFGYPNLTAVDWAKRNG